MPKLIRLYITSVALGFALSAVFLGLLIWQDVAGLGHLVLETASGYVAAIMLFVMNGIIFAGVQFAISVMRLAEDDDEPRGAFARHMRSVLPRLRLLQNLARNQANSKSAKQVAGPQRP